MNRRIVLLAALFLGARFAPALHGLLPHHDESTHCTDGYPFEHFEAHFDHPEHSDCHLCTQVVGGDAVLDLAALDSVRSSDPFILTGPDAARSGPSPSLSRARAPPVSAA